MNKKSIANWSLLAVSILLCVVILEFSSSLIWRNLPQGLSNGKRVVEIYARLEQTVPETIEPHPYMLYQLSRNYSAKGYLQHNSLRYRNPEFSQERPENTLRILALGGSTTYMFPYIADPHRAWPLRLQKRLSDHFKSNVQVINAGLSYATSAELLASYVFRHQYLKPNIIIIHTGGNYIAPLLFEGYNPEYTHFRAHGAGLRPRRFEVGLLKRSYFARVLYANWLNSVETVYQSQPGEFPNGDPAQTLERVRASKSVGFERNLDTLIRLAKANGSQVVLFGFLQAKEENLSRNREDLKGLEKAMVAGLSKHYEIMRRLAEKHDIDFIEPKQDDFPPEYFIDNCHLNEEGDDKKAELLFQSLLARKNKYFRTVVAQMPNEGINRNMQ